MELERLILANEVRDKFERYCESIQHLKELNENVNKGVAYNISITTNDGWGMQRIDIPTDALKEALPIIKDSLIREVKELERQFKEL